MMFPLGPLLHNVAAMSGGGAAPPAALTLNPADASANIVLSPGNLTVQNSAASWDAVRATRSLGTGKYYWEQTTVVVGDGNAGGIADSLANLALTSYWGRTAYSHAAVNDVAIATARYNTTTQTGSSGATHNPIRFAYDGTADLLWVGDSTGWLNGDPVAGTGGLSLSGMSSGRYPVWQGENGDKATFNFGDTAFSSSIPTGYVAATTTP